MTFMASLIRYISIAVNGVFREYNTTKLINAKIIHNTAISTYTNILLLKNNPIDNVVIIIKVFIRKITGLVNIFKSPVNPLLLRHSITAFSAIEYMNI